MYGYVLFLLLGLLLDLEVLQQGVAYIGMDMKTFDKWTAAISST